MAAYGLKNTYIFILIVVLAFFVHGASNVGSDTVYVFVMKGDSVTLHTNITMNRRERFKWYFIDDLIAQINGDLGYNCTYVQCNRKDERFRDRLKLDHQSGDLMIANISTSDTGVYRLQTFPGRQIKKAFNVDVKGVSAEMKEKSVKEGESVTLDTPEEKNNNNLLMWYFNETLIAKITGDPMEICKDVQCKERFRDRLKVDLFGSLTITNIRTTDSGLYQLQITRSSNRFSITSIKSFTVTVTDSGLSLAAIAAIIIILVLSMAAAAVCYRYRQSRKNNKENVPSVRFQVIGTDEKR
ncbi:uncharacterized protein LOC113040387 isoform X2 [Carassius auratus]|uniref:Uncharacterized protein LOC113040387 isoform X2 n=1 Tax=Carassius auratus TaxID=7957 RepID=A0A6P6J4X8_CARAU|nr:uncharacterized protein LOC113040387 isoform X2 [Carassius auratus]